MARRFDRRKIHPAQCITRSKNRSTIEPWQADAIENLLPRLAVPVSTVETDPVALFGVRPKSLWFEIGFGNGEHLADLLERDANSCFIGAEPFVNGMAAFLKSIRDRPDWQGRVRVVMDDARPVIARLPDASLDGIYVLNPDPWPKKRHVKRRIISQESLDLFAAKLKPGAHLIMTTDVDDLAEWMVTEASRHPAFAWTAQSAVDWRTAPEGWIETRYERKGRTAGCRQTYLLFERLAATFA